MALQQPKKPCGGAFGRFLAERREDLTKQCAGRPATAVVKLASEQFKILSEGERAHYQTDYEATLQKYQEDLKVFLDAGGEKTKSKAALRKESRNLKTGKFKPKKDPDRPKKPAGGAFGCFLGQNRAAFMQECPGSITGVTKLASARWKELLDADRAVYDQAYLTKKAQYGAAMKKYAAEVALRQPAEGASEDEARLVPRPAKRAKKDAGDRETDDILAEAKKKGLRRGLVRLLADPAISKQELHASVVLKALEDAAGKLKHAKRALCAQTPGEAKKPSLRKSRTGLFAAASARKAKEKLSPSAGTQAASVSTKLGVVATRWTGVAENIGIGAATIEEALKEGLLKKLVKLMEGKKTKDKSVDAATALQALQAAGGKVADAKKVLLGKGSLQSESGEDDDDDDDAGQAASKAARPKKERTPKAPRAKKEKEAKPVHIDKSTVERAKKEGLHTKLTVLMSEPDIIKEKLDACTVLYALRQAGGKVEATMEVLLGARDLD